MCYILLPYLKRGVYTNRRRGAPRTTPLVMQAAGCMASAWARLVADVGEVNATLILEKEWGHGIPHKVIEAGLFQKARFAYMS